MDTLAFGYILPATGRIRDFHPLETCAARRTTAAKRRLYSRASSSFALALLSLTDWMTGTMKMATIPPAKPLL